MGCALRTSLQPPHLDRRPPALGCTCLYSGIRILPGLTAMKSVSSLRYILLSLPHPAFSASEGVQDRLADAVGRGSELVLVERRPLRTLSCMEAYRRLCHGGSVRDCACRAHGPQAEISGGSLQKLPFGQVSDLRMEPPSSPPGSREFRVAACGSDASRLNQLCQRTRAWEVTETGYSPECRECFDERIK